MSSNEVVGSFEKLDINDEGSNESNVTQFTSPSSTQNTIKTSLCNDEDGFNFIDDGDKAYVVLLNVFGYLSTYDLVAATRVCKVWNRVGTDNIFWKKVCLKNCIIQDNHMMVQTLKNYGTEILDLRGMRFEKTERVLPGTNWSDICKMVHGVLNKPTKWLSLCEALTEVTSLTDVTIKKCTPNALRSLVDGAQQLKSLSVYSLDKELRDYGIDISFLKNMRNLKTFKLENSNLENLFFDTSDEIELKLSTLTITKAINLSEIEHIFPSTLVTLELGVCQSLSSNFWEVVLPKLVNLARLRLEKCQNTYITTMLIEEISKLPNLSELELVNFEIPSSGFGNLISKCTNLKSLLLIPMYKVIPLHLHPLINTSIGFGVRKMQNLQVFVWVVTNEMISVENARTLRMKNKPLRVRREPFGDYISFLFPDDDGYEIRFLSLDTYYSSISLALPNLKFKIFKTNFSSTWKLSLHNIKM